MLERCGQFLRWAVLSLAGGLVLAIVFGIVSEFFIEWAREKGWYENPSQRLDAAMTAVSAFVTQTWFLVVTALFVGLAVGVWLEWFLRRPVTSTNPQPIIDLRRDTSNMARSMTPANEAALIEMLRLHAGSRIGISFVFERDRPIADRLASIFRLAGWEGGVTLLQSVDSILRNVERIDVRGYNEHLVAFVHDALKQYGLDTRPKTIEKSPTKDEELAERIERTILIWIHHS